MSIKLPISIENVIHINSELVNYIPYLTLYIIHIIVS